MQQESQPIHTNNQINSYHNLISPRGARDRLKTKHQQFEEIIQSERDKNNEILRSMVKPYGK